MDRVVVVFTLHFNKCTQIFVKVIFSPDYINGIGKLEVSLPLKSACFDNLIPRFICNKSSLISVYTVIAYPFQSKIYGFLSQHGTRVTSCILNILHCFPGVREKQ